MSSTTREDLELYVMGEFDGDRSALEGAVADSPELRAAMADEAALEGVLRDAAAAATFCPACDDLVRSEVRGERGRVEVGDGVGAAERTRAPSVSIDRCDACGAAVKPGGFVVDRVLVSNAHGRMYVAHDADGTQVALKELAFVQSPTLEVIAAFEREAKFLRALEHPAIPRFVASFEEGSGVHARYYLAQELVTGESLDKRLENHFFTEAEILDIAKQVLEVLVYLQSLSPMVIHRDIKPANLIAKPDGKIAVVDFGAAHVQGTTAGSTSIGTFGYMPIEQLAGQVDATTDPYALGASLLHLLSRREPWRILQGQSLEGINVSLPLRSFLERLVAPDPKQRFVDAQAAIVALEKVARGERIDRIDRKTVKRAIGAGSWLRPALLAAAALGCVAVGFGVRAHVAPAGMPAPTYGKVQVIFAPTTEAELSIDNVSYGRVGSFFTTEVQTGRRYVEVTPGCGETLEVEEGETALLFCTVDATKRLVGRLRIQLHGHHTGRLYIDNHELANTVFNGLEVPVPSGPRTIRIQGEDGSYCETKVQIETDKLTTAECHLGGKRSPAARHPQERIPAGQAIDLDVKNIPLHDVLRTIGDACKLSVVASDSIDAKITIRLKQAPCDQALEVLLQSHGLWYRYTKAGNIALVAPRTEIDREDEARFQRERAGFIGDALPPGPALDLDFKQAPLQDLLRLLADSVGVNIVVPDHIGGKVTVKLTKAPWDATLRTILESQGLGYRYRPNGKLLRIAPQTELDRELEAERAKTQPTTR